MKYDDSFLQLIDRPLDDNQYAALTAEGNTVIAAGAGSGKTQVLATRFAWLVLTGQAEAEEILTLTFTNKAASEMYQRIYKTLRDFAEHEECDKLTLVHKKRAQKALDSFSDVHIQTLDSYCSSIVRQCANRYGIKPDFVTASEDGKRQVKDSAFKFILQNKESLAVKTFAKPGNIQYFAESFFAEIILKHTSLATENGWFSKNFKKQKDRIYSAWHEAVCTNKAGSISCCIEVIKNTLAASKAKDDKTKAPYVAQLGTLFEAAEKLIYCGEILEEAIPAYEELVVILNAARKMKGKISDVNNSAKALQDRLTELASLVYFIKNYDALKDIHRLLDEFLAEVNTSKRVSGNLSFYDVSELALKILLENEDIRNQEKHAFKKIMIDEFQDNNGKNRDLLYLLSLKDGEFEDNGKCKIIIPEGQTLHDLIIQKNEDGSITDKRENGKLFFVGDEKQSIYKFRGADVTVFNELTSSGENNLVYMLYNYRSTPALIKAFNIFFKNGAGIFDSGLSKKEFEAYYEKDAAKYKEELPELNAENVPIHFCMFDKNQIAENDKLLPENKRKLLPEKEQVAFFIAQKIYQLHQEGADWKSIAILDRSRTDRGILTKYLGMFSIPYTIDAYKNIFNDGIVNDFYNFLRICVYPSDINAWAAYLSSPLAGLTENSTEMILSHLTSTDPLEDFFQKEAAIESDLKYTGKDEFNKFIAARDFFAEIKDKVLQQKLTTPLSYLWNDRGYHYEGMMNSKLILCSEQFDMLFELARQTEENGKNAAWFIDQLDILKRQSFMEDNDIDTAEVSYPLERESAVQIMTIHKSKGLQFDHVFVYGCTGISSRVSDGEFYYDDECGVSIKGSSESGNYFFQQTKELEKEKEIAEFRRLIYVAVTRAIKDVYITGSIKYSGNTPNELKLIDNTLLRYYLKPENSYESQAAFDLYCIEAVEYSDLPASSEVSTENLRRQTAEKTEVYSNAQEVIHECHPVERRTPSSLEPEFDAASQQDSDSGEKYEISEDTLSSADFTAADFGTLVHSYLEMQAKGIEAEAYEPEPKFFKNLSDAKIQETKEACIKMSRAFAASTIGAELKAAQEAERFWRAEWGFRMFYKTGDFPEGAIFTGSIDLIYENADGTYTICDYKSDNEINGEKYRGQQECYRAAAAKMLKIPEEKISLFLYFLKHNKSVNIST